MSMSRRKFLRNVAAGTCGAAIHSAVSPWGKMLAFADPLRANATLPVMIIVNLSGGCSYNICPLYGGTYRDLNPTISYGPENSLALDDQQGLHPAFTGLKAIYDEGSLGVINLVGYPEPNRSHDESAQIWWRGSRMKNAAAGGWGARLTCQLGSIFGGVSLSGANVLIQGDCNPPRAFGDLNDFGEDSFWGGSDGTKWLRDSREAVLSLSGASLSENQAYVRESMDSLQRSLDIVRQQTQAAPPGTFPNTGFGRLCRDAAKLVQAQSLGTQFIYLEHGGFDTHSDERTRLTQLLTELNGGLTALAASLKAMGRWNDAMIYTMSEFCRTFENGSQGTDHGHAGPMIVMGGRVKGGVKSPVPTNLETASANGYYHQYHVDFRDPFAAGIRAMGLNPTPVFSETGGISTLDLFS